MESRKPPDRLPCRHYNKVRPNPVRTTDHLHIMSLVCLRQVWTALTRAGILLDFHEAAWRATQPRNGSLPPTSRPILMIFWAGGVLVPAMDLCQSC